MNKSTRQIIAQRTAFRLVSAGKADIRHPVKIFIKNLTGSIFCNGDIIKPIVYGGGSLVRSEGTGVFIRKDYHFGLSQMCKELFFCELKAARKIHGDFIKLTAK